MQLRDFLDILRKRWKIFVASVVLVLAATIGVTLQLPTVYQSSARVFFSTDVGGYVITSDDLNTYLELLGSEVVRRPLRETLGLDPGAPLDVSAAVSETTNVLVITGRAPTAELAADIANAAGPALAEVGGEYSPLLASAGQKVDSTPLKVAPVPGAPISPDIRSNVLLGLLGGVALGLGLVLLRHFLDTRIRSEVDVRAISDRPILGSLHRVRNADRAPLVVEDEPHGVAAEEYRRLRTNLQFADVTTGGQHSFVITSPMPSDGKTLTAVNLARTMADSGAKVLLVDGDLRHPSVASTLGLEGSAGLTSILLGRATLNDVAQQWGTTTLRILPAGEIPPNPSELLGSIAFEVLFNEFLRLYDFVLVDSPPSSPSSTPSSSTASSAAWSSSPPSTKPRNATSPTPSKPWPPSTSPPPASHSTWSPAATATTGTATTPTPARTRGGMIRRGTPGSGGSALRPRLRSTKRPGEPDAEPANDRDRPRLPHPAGRRGARGPGHAPRLP